MVEEELRAGGGVDAADAEDVVDVGVGVGDELDLDAHVACEGEDLVGLIARVYADGLAGAAVADDPAVFLEHADDDAADHDLVRNFHAGSVTGGGGRVGVGGGYQMPGSRRQRTRWRYSA